MLLLAASIVLSTPDSPRPAGATAHAQAIIRIVSAVRVSFAAQGSQDAPRPRQTVVRGADAELLPAKLVEFE